MKYIIAIFSLVFITSFSYAKETCIKNDKGIFCGVEVTVEEKYQNKYSDKNKRECVEFNGKKICGYDCKKNIWGADCKKDKEETCVDNIKGVVCGYNCVNDLSGTACASKSYFKCTRKFNEVKCGTNCDYKFGKFVCDEDDPDAKYLK
jgi:hypothetical protein